MKEQTADIEAGGVLDLRTKLIEAIEDLGMDDWGLEYDDFRLSSSERKFQLKDTIMASTYIGTAHSKYGKHSMHHSSIYKL